MADAIQAPQDASADMQETLKELQAEGHEIPGQTPAPKVEEPEAPAEQAIPSEKTPEQLEADKKAAEDTGKKNEKVEREPKFVPVGKHNDERHKRQEAETRAERAEREAADLRAQLVGNANKPTERNDDLKSAASALAEKHGLDADFVSELLETTTKLTSKQGDLPDELKADLAVIKQARAEAEAHAQEIAQEKGFGNEFAGIVKEFPELADRKEELKQLAFSEGKTNIPLRMVALEYLHDNPPDKPGRRTAEAPVQIKRDAHIVVDFENMDEEQFKGLSDEQHELYMRWLEKNPVRR